MVITINRHRWHFTNLKKEPVTVFHFFFSFCFFKYLFMGLGKMRTIKLTHGRQLMVPKYNKLLQTLTHTRILILTSRSQLELVLVSSKNHTLIVAAAIEILWSIHPYPITFRWNENTPRLVPSEIPPTLVKKKNVENKKTKTKRVQMSKDKNAENDSLWKGKPSSSSPSLMHPHLHPSFLSSTFLFSTFLFSTKVELTLSSQNRHAQVSSCTSFWIPCL
jgi:hypothetical protein